MCSRVLVLQPDKIAYTDAEAGLASCSLLQGVANEADDITRSCAEELGDIRYDVVGHHGHQFLLHIAQAGVTE